RGLLDQADDVAHAENAPRDPPRVEILQRIPFFPGPQQLDWPLRYGPHGERGAAASIAVDAGKHNSADPHPLVKALGELHRVLAGQAGGYEEGLVWPH